MANTLIKITTGESILTQNKSKRELFRKFSSYVSDKYTAVNEFFGVHGSVSDRIWYYGTLSLMLLIPALTYIVSGLIFGF